MVVATTFVVISLHGGCFSCVDIVTKREEVKIERKNVDAEVSQDEYASGGP